MARTGPGPCEMTRHQQVSSRGVKALDGVDFRLLPRRGARADGRERRRQVHPDQGAHRRLRASTRGDDRRSTARPVRFAGPLAGAATPAISTVYQEVNLCPNLSVAENILLGREPRRLGAHPLAGDAPPRRRAARPPRPRHRRRPRRSARYSLAVQQMVAIARADRHRRRRCSSSTSPPPASTPTRSRELFRVMRAAAASEGIAILFVSHFLDQVYEITDRITVLRNGRLVGEYLTARAAAARAGRRR